LEGDPVLLRLSLVDSTDLAVDEVVLMIDEQP
jgi:hypothetical protein